MAVHRFAQPSLIDEVTFVNTEKGGVRAYLHAREGSEPEKLQAVLKDLYERGWQSTPFDLKGKPTLEIRNFDKEKKLLAALKESKAVEGDAQVEKGEKLSLWDLFKKRTLQLSGISYIVGDVGFVKFNLKEADNLGVMGALFYFLGTLSLIGYGRNEQSDLQVRDMTQNLQHFLHQKDVAIPEDCGLHKVGNGKKKTLIQNLDEFARRYPSEIFNTVTAIAGVFVASSAARKIRNAQRLHGHDIKALNKHLLEGWMDVGLGTLTAASGTLATIVKEKKPDPDEPPAKGADWLWQKVQEHPLAIAGGGYTIATMCHAASTFVAYKEAKRVNDQVRLKSIPWRGLFVGAAFLSEFLLAISSKGHGEGVTSDESVDKSVYAIAAEMIAKQKPEEREWHLQHVAGFLQQPNVMAESYDVVEKNLRDAVAKVQNNPWLCHDAPAPKQEAPATAPSLAAKPQTQLTGARFTPRAHIAAPALS